jgi:hypothetical protein
MAMPWKHRAMNDNTIESATGTMLSKDRTDSFHTLYFQLRYKCILF